MSDLQIVYYIVSAIECSHMKTLYRRKCISTLLIYLLHALRSWRKTGSINHVRSGANITRFNIKSWVSMVMISEWNRPWRNGTALYEILQFSLSRLCKFQIRNRLPCRRHHASCTHGRNTRCQLREISENGSSKVVVMACCRFGAKLLLEPYSILYCR